MKKSMFLALAMATGLTLLGTPAKEIKMARLPMPVACGQLVAFKKSVDLNYFVSLEKAAKEDQGKPDSNFPSDLVDEKQPDPGMLYAVFTFQIAKGRTLSPLDYVLENDRGNVSPCLGMGRETSGFYDFRMRKLEGPARVNLIFMCPDDSYELKLKSAFPNITLPVLGDFIVKERPKPVAPPPAPAAPAGAAAPDAAAPATPAAPAQP